MKKIDREQYAIFKQLFEKLLQDDKIKRASTPTFRDFKKNANDFLKKYPNASDTELSIGIINTINIIYNFNNNKDVQYMVKVMSENGIEKIFDNYMRSYVW